MPQVPLFDLDELERARVHEVRTARKREQRERRQTEVAVAKQQLEESPLLLPPALNIDVHLAAETGWAEAHFSGSDLEVAAVWLSEVVSTVEPVTKRRWRFPTSVLDRLLWPTAGAIVTMDPGAETVARALWARQLGCRPMQVIRDGHRLTGRSIRGDWPAQLRVREAPWQAVLALMDLAVPVTVTRDAARLVNVRLSDRHIGTASWAGSYVRIESGQIEMMSELAAHLPGLAYDGLPGDGRYRLPALHAPRLLGVPSIRVTDEVREHIDEIAETVEPIQPPQPFPFALHSFQTRDIARARQIVRLGGGVLLAGDMGSGKATGDSTKVLTPSGWALNGSLRVGDQVIGSDGCATIVTGVFPQPEGTPMYRVTFSDRTHIDVTDEHLWAVITPRDMWQGEKHRVKTTRELAEGLPLRDTNGYRRWFIPIVKPVQHPTANLVLDPYVLGCLLGDGSITQSTPTMTSADPELIEEMRSRLPAGVKIRGPGKRGIEYALPKDGTTQGRKNPLTEILRDLQVWGHTAHSKFVPEVFLFGDVQQRLDLLRGLMDTDGSPASTCRGAEFSSASPQLSQDVQQLVQSLGGTATLSVKKTTHADAHRLYINMPADINPFLLARKADIWAAQTPQGPPTRSIASIEPIEPVPATCISVDAADSLYVTEHHIVTHNTAVAAAMVAIEDWWPVAIICPLAAMTAWQRQLDDMGRTYHLATSSAATDRLAVAAGGFDALIMSYDRLHTFTDMLDGSTAYVDGPDGPVASTGWAPAAIVADELQYIRSPGSRRSRSLRSLAAHVPVRIGLTGTPIMNRLSDIAAQGAFLLPGEFRARGGKANFSDVYVHDDPVQGAAEHLGAFMVRRKMSDTGVVLPAAHDWKIEVEITGAQREALARLEEDARTAAESGQVVDKMHAFTLLHKQRRIVACPGAEGLPGGNPKAVAMLEIVERGWAEGKKSVVFFNYRHTFDDYKHALDMAGIGWVAITGSHSPAERAEAERRFHHDGSVAVILGSYGAMNAAVTLSPTGRLWIAEPHPDLGITSQARARVRRLNQTDPIDLISLVAPDTFDERIMELLDIKRELFARVVDGEEGASAGALDTSLDDLLYLLTGQGALS